MDMNRRTFLNASLAVAGAATAVGACAEVSAPAGAREYYELRSYTLKPEKQPLLDEYLSKAFIPAAGRLGCGPVGVFTEPPVDGVLTVTVLTVFQTADQFATFAERLGGDAEHQKAGATYLSAAAADPVYLRVESSIIHALSGMPKIVAPDAGKPHIMNLRIYESHNERAGLKKIEMFNEGEFDVFKRAEMPMVLCGQTIIGGKMPNLTYMLTFPDEAGRKAGWGRFGKNDPVWKKFRSMHEYDDKEIVMHITNRILTPTSYSQL